MYIHFIIDYRINREHTQWIILSLALSILSVVNKFTLRARRHEAISAFQHSTAGSFLIARLRIDRACRRRPLRSRAV